MDITQIQVGHTLYPLIEGQPVPVRVGQTLRVFYSFSYKVAEETAVPIWASLYRYTVGLLNRSSQAQAKSTITLDKSAEWKTYQGQIDIVIGNIASGLWGLIVELPGFKDAEAKIDDCIEVTAAPGIIDILPVLMAVMMMGMIVPMMEEVE